MAIKAIDIRSSTTAKDNKNTLRAGLNLLENKINIPTANAISVDIGMQNPLKNWLFLFINITSCLSHFILILHIAYYHFYIQKGAL